MEKKSYFPSIDGMRAIAVLAVIIYHLNPSALPGGFVGVDIFFVISGFVVTRSIFRDSHKRFIPFLSSFYSRRFVRILPPLLVTVSTTVIVFIILIPDAWLSDAFRLTGLASYVGLSNFALIASNDGYFAPRAEFNPFTHTWSLAVEEQFYVLFPLILFAFVFRAHRYFRHCVIFLTVCSFAWSAYVTDVDPSSAYYMLPSRFWELGVGAWLGILTDRTRARLVSAVGKDNLDGIALVLIFISLIAADENYFPFPWALPAGLGTLLLILTASVDGKRSRVEELLSNKWIVAIGLISYSLYLWHWPVITLMRWTWGLDTWPEYMIAFSSSMLLATASWYWLENPIRRLAKGQPSRNIIGAGLVITSVFLLISYMAYQHEDKLKRSVVSTHKEDWYPTSVGEFGRVETPCKAEWINLPSGQLNFIPKNCKASLSKSDTILFVNGDSHAGAYTRMFDAVTRLTGLEVRRSSMAGCSLLSLQVPTSAYTEECKQFQKHYLEQLLTQAKPGDVLFLPALRLDRLSEQWNEPTHTTPTYQFMQKWNDMVAAERDAKNILQILTDKKIQVLIELPKPLLPFPPYRCADTYTQHNPICLTNVELDRKFMDYYRQPIIDMVSRLQMEFPSIKLWDPMKELCDKTVCKAYRSGRPLFFDGDHISGYANDQLLPSFLNSLRQVTSLTTYEPEFSNSDIEIDHGRYPALPLSLIDFRRPGLPDFLERVTGLSDVESWGRWSDANNGRLILKFKENLPPNLRILLTVKAVGPNVNAPITVEHGGIIQTFYVEDKEKDVELDFEGGTAGRSIQIIPPAPILAKELSPSSKDSRMLAIGLVKMEIMTTGR